MLGQPGGLRACSRAEAHPCPVERRDVTPEDVGHSRPSGTNPQPNDFRIRLELYDEVDKAADRGSLPICDLLADNLGKPKHPLPGLHAAARGQGGYSQASINRHAAGGESKYRIEVELRD